MSLPDPLDEATIVIERATAEALARTRAKAAPEQVQNADGSWPVTECVDCDADIPTARLAHGRIRCFECQSALEKRRKHYAR